MTAISFTSVEIKEVRAACGARLREPDKAFKACIKGGVQSAAEQVAENIKTIRNIDGTLAENDTE